MQTHLRPMSLGEILDRTAQLYRTNFLLFSGIASVYAGVLLVINLIQLGLNQLMIHWKMTQQLPWASLGYVALIFPVILLCAVAAVAANNRAVAWVNLGQPATIRGAYKSIWPRFGRYLWLATIMAFIVYAPFILVFGGYCGFLYGYARPKGFFQAGGQNSDPGALIVVGLVSLVLFGLLVAWVVYAILMGLRYSLAVAACVIEDIPARQAIRRSIALSKESRGRIFVLGLLIFAIQIGLVMITQLVFFVAAFLAVRKHSSLPVWMLALQQLVGFFTNSFIGPMYATGLTLFYYDQRIRKEGFDIEMMMEAAGMNPASTDNSGLPAQSATESAAVAPGVEPPATIREPDPEIHPVAEPEPGPEPERDPPSHPEAPEPPLPEDPPEGSHG